jgi:hypothetical protein
VHLEKGDQRLVRQGVHPCRTCITSHDSA